jgi:glycosyltransferase involved in cell wall biosynthesis
MKILVLAPHPFYQERGTPIAVDMLVRALCERGDNVDVLTFHEGEDRQYSGLRVLRIRPWLPVKDIRPGFSFNKIICDMHLFFRFLLQMTRERYDVVHAVEEASFMAMLICPVRSVPFVYDMDSSMTTQLVDKYRTLRPLRPLLSFLESLPMRFAAAVVPMCDALASEAARHSKRVVVLKDVSLVGCHGQESEVDDLREQMHLSEDNSISMYIGNLEPYQGIDLMLNSFALVVRRSASAHLVVIGGNEIDIGRYRRLSDEFGLEEHVHFLGRRTVQHIGGYMSQADVLVSPRILGVNTPMKIYSYLDSGTAVLATNLPTHTQVLTDVTAALAPPEPDGFALAWHGLLADRTRRDRLAKNAREYVRREHSYEAFRTRLEELYEAFELRRQPAGTG